MNYDWENIKWIFRLDGSLRDIYIQEIDLSYWLKLIDHLNCNYSLKYGTYDNHIENKIDKEYVINQFNDKTGTIERKFVSIDVNDINIVCHFFLTDEIEFDINPAEVYNIYKFDSLISFMQSLSNILNKTVILTRESCPNFPLIKVNYTNNLLAILSKEKENQLSQSYYKRKYSIYNKLCLFLFRRFPKLFINQIIDSSNRPHMASRKDKNVW